MQPRFESKGFPIQIEVMVMDGMPNGWKVFDTGNWGEQYATYERAIVLSEIVS